MKKKHLFNAIMRITVINIALALTVIGGALASNTSAQVLNRKLTLNAKDKEISNILATIEREANITFIYSPVLIQANNKVTVSFKNETLSNILSRLLTPQNIKYEVSGNTIVLNRIIHPGGKPGEAGANQTENRQAIGVTGNITDEAGQPLIGVSVTIKGSTNAVSTDNNGNYKINVPDNSAVLVFRYIGFITQETAVNGRTVINVKLAVDSRSLNEVVVVGYGSQKRAEVTGAISSVSGSTLTSLPTASIDEALQGRVAGLSVVNNGSPGTQPLVVIRGISSISFGSDPLFVVDGFPLAGGLGTFDARDVEDVEVLKDASSAAIYGSRATNGVILITTKKGSRTGKMTMNINTYTGVQSPSKYLDLLNTNQYVQYATALDGAGNLPPRLQPANFNKPVYAGASQTYAQTNTDWQRAYFKSNALLTSTNLSLSGGNDVSRFYSAAGYFKQDGIAQGLSYERANYRLNSDHIINKFVTVGQNLYIAGSTQHFDQTGGSNRTPLVNVVRMQPYIPLHDPTTNGGYQGPISSFDGSDPTNPVEFALIGSNTNNTTDVLGTLYVELSITPWLKFRSTAGGNYIMNLGQGFQPVFSDGGTLSTTSSTLSFQRNTTFSRLFSQQLSFNKTFGQHHITATAVYESQNEHDSQDSESGNQALNSVRTLDGAVNIQANNFNTDNVIQSLVGRVTYDFEGKYLINGSIRRDGYSIWAPGHKYANFPAVSAGWNVSQEDFLKDSKTISELKLRAGYGVTGNNAASLGPYPYLSSPSLLGTEYPFGGVIGNPNGSYTSGITNPQLNWEKTKQLNIGVDLGFLNNKFTVVAEYYRRQTDNLIIVVPTPTSEGFGGAGSLQNIASMRNNGFELQLGYHKTNGDFKYDITGLISAVTNKVLHLNAPTATIVSGGDGDFGGGAPFTKTEAGQSIQYFYGWVSQGIFQTQGQIDALNAQAVAKHGAGSVYQTGAAPGDIMFKDVNGDGIVDANDKTNIGSFLPKFTYSLNYSASYKNFDAAIFFQGVYGNKILDALRIIEEGMPRLFNSDTQVLKAWTPGNTNTTVPRTIANDPNFNARLSTRWIENGSYLRLKNLVIGYTLPTGSLTSLSGSVIKRLRFYVSGQNLLTFTGYKGYDPEIGSKNGTLENGVDFGQYPSARTFQIGLQAGL